MRIALTSAGADDGKLAIHSRQPLKLVDAAGLQVVSVAAGSGDVWTITVAERKRNQTQQIVLNIE